MAWELLRYSISTPLAPRPGLMFNNGPRIVFSWPQMLICNGGELVGGPTDSCGKCVGGPLDCGLCCGGGLYPTLDPPTFP